MNNTIARLTAVALASVFLAQSVQANSGVDKRFYLSPMLSYGFFDENTFEPDDEFGAQLVIGKNLDRIFALELSAFYFDDVDLDRNSDNLDSYGVGLDVLAFPARHILPFFALVGGGIGEHDVDPRVAGLNDESSDFYNVGAGLLLPITNSGLAVRTEYRYRSTDVDVSSGGDLDFRDNIVSLGLQIPLGSSRSGNEPFPWPAERRQPPPPAAKPAPRPAPPPPPVPVRIDNDTDDDGVLNRWDKCPNSALDETVDLDGCPASDQAPLYVLEGVHFAYDSSALAPTAQRELDKVAAALEGSPNLAIRVEGHTDDIASDAYNLRLSRERANSVMRYLSAHGVAERRMSAYGYGETRPVVPNTSAENRARNRRVELQPIR